MPHEFTRQHIFNLDFIAEDNFDNIIRDIIERPADNNEFPAIITPNVDLTVHLNNNPTLLSRFQQSRFILPDGFPIILLSKLLGKPLKNRLAGSDLFPVTWKAIIQHQKKVFLILPNEAVAAKLKQEYGDMQYYIPPFFDATNEDVEFESEKIFPLLLLYQPDFVFLGLRYPKQEMLIVNLHDKLKNTNNKMPLFFNLGASYEFYTGMKKRAPLWMQKIGMEWLHRFLSEPRRTFKRYFWDDLFIFKMFLKELFKKC
ncbi:MAG: teichoic acid biosynthesis protein [Bacteroidota bacterium]|nr:teichoic acid biosynthesis protein [Bacteroidota bacterium]